MQLFANRLNASNWFGSISEVGLGLEFSSSYLRIPGVSKTIASIVSFYAKEPNSTIRAVSKEAALNSARNEFCHANELAFNRDNGERAFGFAITGAHYEDRDSHGWMAIVTKDYEAYLHFTIKRSSNREDVGLVSSSLAQWFLTNCLLENGKWDLGILETSFYGVKLDVIYAPGISDYERLMLLTETHPLVYHNGEFQRVEDYLRKYEVIYPGAFNPPTKHHLSVGERLYEISKSHFYKGNMSMEDMMHRVRMLDLHDKPVLLTMAPRFVDKYRAIGQRTIKFLIGADAWNKTIEPCQYPSQVWLSQMMPDASFVIMQRKGEQIESNSVSQHLDHTVIDSDLSDISSTQVRSGDLNMTTPEIREYILKNGLYGLKSGV